MDARRFKELFLPCSRTMYWAAFRLTGNTAEAEDLVQEAFMKLWVSRDKLEKVENAEAYSVQTMRRLFFDKCRKSSLALSPLPPAGDLQGDATYDLEREIELRQQSEQVLKTIEKLPEQQRQIITLRDIDGHSYEEIGQTTGLTQANIRVILSRARKSIREKFSSKNR